MEASLTTKPRMASARRRIDAASRDRVARTRLPQRRQLSDAEIIERCMYALVNEGVRAVEAAPGAMILKGARSSQRANVGADFAAARALVARI